MSQQTESVNLTNNNMTPSNLKDLFQTVSHSGKNLNIVNTIFNAVHPISILLEGSSYTSNIDTLNAYIEPRNNYKDTLILIDVDKQVVSNHQKHITDHYSNNNYQALIADMNQLPMADKSFDLVIHNFTINFNRSMFNENKPITEIKRVLKSSPAACLFSVAVLPNKRQVNRLYSSFSGTANINHTSSFYEEAFSKAGIKYQKFESSRKKNLFPFNRYLLQTL